MTDPFSNLPVCDCNLDLEGKGRYSDVDCGAPRLTGSGIPVFKFQSVLPQVGPQVEHAQTSFVTEK